MSKRSVSGRRGQGASEHKDHQDQQRRHQQRVVQVALPEDLRAGLMELMVEVGVRGVQAMLEEDRTRLCGPRYERSPQRRARRFGSAPGELVLGGRRVRMSRPRVRTVEGEELALPTWEHCRDEDPLAERAVEQMVVGVATRKYARSLERFDELDTFGDSKSAVSRRFVAKTRESLDEFLSRDLTGMALTAVMIDGVHFGEHVILTALGIDEQGNKLVLGIHEGATENAAACKELLSNLVARGLATDRAMLFVIDGAKALHKAIRDVFGKLALIQRCQVHKKRNVHEHLPERMRGWVGAAISAAYSCTDAAKAKKQLLALAARLEEEHPGAAASLREGLDETLTVMKLGLPRALERTLATTNPIENLFSSVRRLSSRVTRWRGGLMALRWAAAALVEAEKRFHRVKGKKGMPKLAAALRAHEERVVGSGKDVA